MTSSAGVSSLAASVTASMPNADIMCGDAVPSMITASQDVLMPSYVLTTRATHSSDFS